MSTDRVHNVKNICLQLKQKNVSVIILNSIQIVWF